MAGRAFIDTNIAVYLLADDAAKARRAESLLAARPCISTQVANEFINVCTRKLKLDRAAVHAAARSLMAHCEVLPVSARTVDAAMRLCERYGFSHWDSLIVAAAQLAGCDTLYSEDMQHGQQLDGLLRIQNPFL
ncbi:MAG: PIN domain-containing protein [Acidovorax sp.]|uniref:PIN domain-containing protein n=1 Tax=Acidovorax sp. TaxID=1872122 RepID=UPI0039E22CF0